VDANIKVGGPVLETGHVRRPTAGPTLCPAEARCTLRARSPPLRAGSGPPSLLGGWFWRVTQAPSSTGGSRRVRGADTL